jgi:PKD repeat protein
VNLVVTDNDGATGTTDQSVTVNEPGTVHVGDLDGSLTNANKNFWWAEVKITVHDQEEGPVVGATVQGTWSDGTAGSCSSPTVADGTCTVVSPKIPIGQETIVFEVNGITHATLPYVSEDNQDPDGDSDGTTIVVSQSGNQSPVAVFTYGCTDLTCDFDGSGSSDSDGTIVSYDWDFGDGNTSTQQNPSHTYATAGIYSVSLTVTDDDGATDTTSQSVTVGASNVPPTADFSFSTTDLTASFTDASTDSDGTVDSWSWDFGDGNTSTEQNPSHTYATAGTYIVVLSVTDNDGASNDNTQSVTVSDGTGGLTLSASGYKVRAIQHADLTWSGASSADIDVYRDGAKIATVANNGAHTDNIGTKKGGPYTYKICEAGTATCSNEAVVSF